MKRVFADADFFIALLKPKEQLHAKAKAIVTSEMVLAEVMTFYADKGADLREAEVAVSLRLGGDPNATVIPQTSIKFREALSFYRQYKDKEWGLTDCASFLIMRETGLAEALTHDHHFEQAGFKALLRSG
jgi:predicted nucleic acid-binding protein